MPQSDVSPQESAARLAHMALDMQSLCESYTAPDGSTLKMRIGIHAGPVVAGIVGVSMIRYQCVIEGPGVCVCSILTKPLNLFILIEGRVLCPSRPDLFIWGSSLDLLQMDPACLAGTSLFFARVRSSEAD